VYFSSKKASHSFFISDCLSLNTFLRIGRGRGRGICVSIGISSWHIYRGRHNIKFLCSALFSSKWGRSCIITFGTRFQGASVEVAMVVGIKLEISMEGTRPQIISSDTRQSQAVGYGFYPIPTRSDKTMCGKYPILTRLDFFWVLNTRYLPDRIWTHEKLPDTYPRGKNSRVANPGSARV
jgi:hypothetical protein